MLSEFASDEQKLDANNSSHYLSGLQLLHLIFSAQESLVNL